MKKITRALIVLSGAFAVVIGFIGFIFEGRFKTLMCIHIDKAEKYLRYKNLCGNLKEVTYVLLFITIILIIIYKVFLVCQKKENLNR